MRSLLVLAFLAAPVVAAPLAAQTQPELLQIEVAAARSALSTHNYARSMIRVEPAYCTARAAPGSPTSQQRPADRTRALNDALAVPASYERPFGNILLLMSEPAVTGDAAEVTVTVYQTAATGRLNFETILVTLRRESGSWRAVKREMLGRS